MDLADAEATPAIGPREQPRLPAPAVAGVLLLGALAAGYLWIGVPAVLFSLCAGAGYGVTYLARIPLDPEERFFFGAVIGAMVATLAGFGLASAFGLTAVTVWGGVAVAVAASLPGWWQGRDLQSSELAELRRRWLRSPLTAGHPWPLLLVALVGGAYTLKVMSAAYQMLPQGLYVGGLGIWGDWAAHLTYTGSFAYGKNFPPEFPIDPGHKLGYPFMIDFLAASLVPLGAGLTTSLVLTSGYLALAFPGVMHLAAVRFLGGRLAATLAFFVFVLGGGLGFLYLARDVDTSGWGILQHLPHEYTHMGDLNYQWLNPVLANLLPQRSTLFGFSVLLIALAILFSARAKPGWAPFVFAGVLVGITPSFHVHSYGTAVALAVFWAVFNRRREWLGFLVPALLIGVPAVLWMWPPAHTVTCPAHVVGLCIQPGWLADSAGHSDPIWWFWLKNLGLFVPLVLLAQFWKGLTPTGFSRHFAPVWLWFLVPNVVLFHPWDWDNNKFFIFFTLFGSLMVGALLAALFLRSREGGVLAAALCVALGLSGGLDLLRSTQQNVSTIQFTDNAGLAVADWVRSNTDPRAIFLTAPEHNSPIPSLGGRRVVLGYTGWVWSYGLSDWSDREVAIKAMLAGSPETPALLARYHVAYVAIGPQERSYADRAKAPVNEVYWGGHATVVYKNSEYTIYEIA